MRFDARHGYHDWEQTQPQPFEVDVELVRNLQPAGVDDDLEQTIDYEPGLRGRPPDRRVRRRSDCSRALAEAIAHELLVDFDVIEVGVRVRKPAVQLGGPLDYAAVEIWRRRSER